jgi:hypothetical protein
MSTVPFVRDHAFRDWTQYMGTTGIGSVEAQQHFAAWAKEDYYPPVSVELSLLAQAGFAEPDVFWRKAPFIVLGGIR